MDTLALLTDDFVGSTTECRQVALAEFLEILDESAVASRVLGETCECALDRSETDAEPLSTFGLSHY
jgi:hypothetical protein